MRRNIPRSRRFVLATIKISPCPIYNTTSTPYQVISGSQSSPTMLTVTNQSKRTPIDKRMMPFTYKFKDSKVADSVARALLFVAKFSKKQAYVRFSDSSVSVIWGGSPKTFYIHAGTTAFDMFKKDNPKHYGIDHCTLIQVDPTILGKTLKGYVQDKNVKIIIIRPNKLKVCVDYEDTSKRGLTHTIPCEFKSQDDYKSMLIEEIERSLCRYNTRSYVDNVHRLKHIFEIFVKLNTARVYIWSKQIDGSNDLTIVAKTQGSNIRVSISDLEGENDQQHLEIEPHHLQQPFGQFGLEEASIARRTDAGVNIDTKRLAAFLSGLVAHKRSRLTFDIEHNKCLKITHDNEISQGEKFYQSILLLHSLNN